MATTKRFVVCISNTGYEMSFERRKIYEVRRDQIAQSRGLLRVADESGKDHLFPLAASKGCATAVVAMIGEEDPRKLLLSTDLKPDSLHA